jgi:Subtilase family/Common central domain of tyrosinase
MTEEPRIIVEKPVFMGIRMGAALEQVSSLVRAPSARDHFDVDGSGVTVAVLDTGVNPSHVDFAGRIVAQADFTDDPVARDLDGHGSNVAGIVLASGQHHGIAPGAQLASVKVLNGDGGGSLSWLVNGLKWVRDNAGAHNIRVVCMSLGFGDNQQSDDDVPTFFGELRGLIQELTDHNNIAVVIAAGNDFYTHQSAEGMATPAIFRECVSVGAVYDADVGGRAYASGAVAYETDRDVITPFSQRLPHNAQRPCFTTIFAPGAPVTSTGHSGTQTSSEQSGTSQAAPVVAGVIALFQQLYHREHGDWPTVAEVKKTLREAAVAINDGDDERDNVTSTGKNFLRVDAYQVLERAVLPRPAADGGDGGELDLPAPRRAPTQKMAGVARLFGGGQQQQWGIVTADGASFVCFSEPDRPQGGQEPKNLTELRNHEGRHVTVEFHVRSGGSLYGAAIVGGDIEAADEEAVITWHDPIRGYFRARDIACMRATRFDLASYDDVKRNAWQIYGVLKAHEMPGDEQFWSDEQLDNFLTWIRAGFPRGSTAGPMAARAQGDEDVRRLRKGLHELSVAERQLLIKAFNGIKALPADDPRSYASLARIHGEPWPFYCWHHVSGFISWHRQYLNVFEDALRSIDGCEEVTLPYWDIYLGAPPQWLWDEDAFTFTFARNYAPRHGLEARGPGTDRPQTIRGSRTYIQRVLDFEPPNGKSIRGMLRDAMLQDSWESFGVYSPQLDANRGDSKDLELPHDHVHGLAAGSHPFVSPEAGQLLGDLATPNFASFDPLFWFFHADFDRLSWEWQRRRGAFDTNTLTAYFELPELVDEYLRAPLVPWDDTTFEDLLDLRSAGIDYTRGSLNAEELPIVQPSGTAFGGNRSKLAVQVGAPVLIVSNINRLAIDGGSFFVRVYAGSDGNDADEDLELVGTATYFQFAGPTRCNQCREQPLVRFTFPLRADLTHPGTCFFVRFFDVHQQRIADGTFSDVKIELRSCLLSKSGNGNGGGGNGIGHVHQRQPRGCCAASSSSAAGAQ